MKQYVFLQIKRMAKALPQITAITVILLIGLTAILYGLLTLFVNESGNQRFTIAVAGDTDNEYFRLGMTAMQVLDETRFSIEFAEMSEQDAQKALEKGQISAYVVIPKDFVKQALYGNIEPITYVTSAGMSGVTDLFKREITTLVTNMVVDSQKGAYGLYDALADKGLQDQANRHMSQISIEYAELIFKRHQLYEVEELGISDGLSTPEYYVCAVLLVLLVLIGLPFATVYIKRDYAFHRVLASRGYSAGRQLLSELPSHLLALLSQVAVILVFTCVALRFFSSSDNSSDMFVILSRVVIRVLPITVMLSAFNMMMFELADTIVSGLLLHFFVVVALCYISGCLYPIHAFPTAVQTLSSFLPTGMAREYLASAFTYDTSVYNLLGLAIYTFLFLGTAFVVRYRQIARIRG